MTNPSLRIPAGARGRRTPARAALQVSFCDELSARRATRLEPGGRKVLDRALLDPSAEDADLAVCHTLVVTAKGREAFARIEQDNP